MGFVIDMPQLANSGDDHNQENTSRNQISALVRLVMVAAIYLTVKDEWPIDGWNKEQTKSKEDEKPTQSSNSRKFLLNAFQTLIITHLFQNLSLYSLYQPDSLAEPLPTTVSIQEKIFSNIAPSHLLDSRIIYFSNFTRLVFSLLYMWEKLEYGSN